MHQRDPMKYYDHLPSYHHHHSLHHFTFLCVSVSVCLSSISLSIHTYLSFPVFISLSRSLSFFVSLLPTLSSSISCPLYHSPSLNTVSLFLRLSHSSSYTVCFYFYLSLLSSRSQYFSRIRLLFPIPSHLSILFRSFSVFFTSPISISPRFIPSSLRLCLTSYPSPSTSLGLHPSVGK